MVRCDMRVFIYINLTFIGIYLVFITMRFVKQQYQLPVQNMELDNKIERKKHGKLFPHSIRGLITGPSNCGKTNVMMSLLLHPNGLKFENIYVYSKSLHQPKYEFLRKAIKPIKNMGFFTFSNNCDVIRVEEAKPNSIFIFDDIACEKQDTIRVYFSMGRHHHIDSFYLCQTYTRIPKHLIRDNANFLIVFKQDDMNLKHIYNDHVNSDMTFKMFQKVCAECWNTNYGFVVIDKDSPLNEGRYRKGFDCFLKL